MGRQQQFGLRIAMSPLIKTFYLLLALIAASSTAAIAADDNFPRLGNYQIGGWASYSQTRIDRIAKLDVAIIQLFRNHNIDGHTISSIVADIKGQNPDIVLLQYTLVSSIPNGQQDLVSYLEGQSGAGGQGDWFARTTAGNKTSEWPGQSVMNITRFVSPNSQGDRVPQWYSKVLNEDIFNLAPFDGNFIDVMRPKPQVVADWDGDGSNDSADEASTWYSTGQRDFYDAHRAAWPNHIMTANITRWEYDQIPDYYQGILQGGLMEAIIGLSWSPHTWGGWDGMMEKYRGYMSHLSGPRYGIFHAIGQANDYQFMRYALTSCMMDDGYFAHTTNESYNEIAWFDEYDVDVGFAVDAPQTTPWKNGVYRRRFSQGMALVNPAGNGTQTVEIEPGYRKIQGVQDPAHNDGSASQTITLRAGDGIILVSENAPLLSKPNPPTLQ